MLELCRGNVVDRLDACLPGSDACVIEKDGRIPERGGDFVVEFLDLECMEVGVRLYLGSTLFLV